MDPRLGASTFLSAALGAGVSRAGGLSPSCLRHCLASHVGQPFWSARAAVAAGLDLTNKEMAAEADVSERTIRDAKAAHKGDMGEAVKAVSA